MPDWSTARRPRGGKGPVGAKAGAAAVGGDNPEVIKVARTQAADVGSDRQGRIPSLSLCRGGVPVASRRTILEATVVVDPRGLTEPLSVAETLATFVAGLVVTAGLGVAFVAVAVGVAVGVNVAVAVAVAGRVSSCRRWCGREGCCRRCRCRRRRGCGWGYYWRG